jgi:hypothetical protein
MQKRGVLEDKKDYPKVLKTISKIGQNFAFTFSKKENASIVSALHRFFYKQDLKKENYKEVLNSCSPSSKPSEIRSSPSSNPLLNRRQAPEPISKRWRTQRRAYF